MSDDWIGVTQKNGVGILRLNRPDVMNAISPAMAGVLGRQFKAMATPGSGIRCIVITGEGRAFCSGANLDANSGNDTAGANAGSVLQLAYHPLLRLIRDSEIPVVTAVNGVAAGAGMSIAMMGDLITCAKSGYFIQAFRRIGLVMDCGSSWLLPRLIGNARARELSLLGSKLDADTALQWGLVNRVFEDATFMDETLALAMQLADGPVGALGKIRRLYWETTNNSFEEQLNLEDTLQMIASESAEAKEGVAAFREKRPADFRKV